MPVAVRVLDLSFLTIDQGFVIQGDTSGHRAGSSVSSAGDVNGDGIDDLIVGTPFGGDGGSNAGEAYVIYGVAGATRGTLDLTGLTAAQGFVIQGDAAGRPHRRSEGRETDLCGYNTAIAAFGRRSRWIDAKLD